MKQRDEHSNRKVARDIPVVLTQKIGIISEKLENAMPMVKELVVYISAFKMDKSID